MRSESSRFTCGRLRTSASTSPYSACFRRCPSAISRSTSVSASPKNTLTMAGGASWPPRRSSLPGQAAARRSRSAYWSTAASTAHSTTRNTGFSSGVRPGFSRFFAGVCYKAPVIVFARAVHACERLFVQKAGKSVAQRHFAHQLHHHLVVVAGDVGRAEHAGQFVLAGGHLVVLGFGGHANAPQFVVQLAHEGAHTLGNAAVIVVAQLLPFGRFAPSRVRPHTFKSRRLSNSSLSTRKYSCSAPTVGSTETVSLSPSARSTRSACRFSA